jgi:HSF-type DNA-binding
MLAPNKGKRQEKQDVTIVLPCNIEQKCSRSDDRSNVLFHPTTCIGRYSDDSPDYAGGHASNTDGILKSSSSVHADTSTLSINSTIEAISRGYDTEKTSTTTNNDAKIVTDYYKDYSTHPDPDPLTPLTSMGRVPNFPAKIHAILSRNDFSNIICWMPHGRSWRVLDPTGFEQLIIPKYFGHSKFSSFIRQVNGWGFRRITCGIDTDSYCNPLFLRGLPYLCKLMVRCGSEKDRLGKMAFDGIDLHKLSEFYPVPTHYEDDSVLLPCTLTGGPKARMSIPEWKQSVPKISDFSSSFSSGDNVPSQSSLMVSNAATTIDTATHRHSVPNELITDKVLPNSSMLNTLADASLAFCNNIDYNLNTISDCSNTSTRVIPVSNDSTSPNDEMLGASDSAANAISLFVAGFTAASLMKLHSHRFLEPSPFFPSYQFPTISSSSTSSNGSVAIHYDVEKNNLVGTCSTSQANVTKETWKQS